MEKNVISGWYYDLQTENKLLRVSLHPNQILDKDGVTWKDVPESDQEPSPQDNPGYRKTPICTAIATEDFNVAVANNWSDFGGDMIGQMWDSVKSLAPYAGNLEAALRQADANYQRIKDTEKGKKIKESKLSSLMAEGIHWLVNKHGNDISEYLNRSLIVQGTRFSYYSGSGTSFSNLVMKFLVFPKWKNETFVSVNSQIEELLPYCIGKFVTFRGKDPNKKTEAKDNSGEEKTLKELDDMVGWQKPPGGFKANVRSVDTVQKGTLLLKFGAYYAINNLVVENATFSFSRQMVKNPSYRPGTIATNEVKSSIISPLYCDVTIQLRPATKYSDSSLKDFVFGMKNANSIKDLSEELHANIKYKGGLQKVGANTYRSFE